MATRDGRETARRNQLTLLKMLHRHGYLRSRDAAALGWMRRRAEPPAGDFIPRPVVVPESAIRMAQRTLRRLMNDRQIFAHTAPDGSRLYALTEAGARTLQELGILAKSGKTWLRRFSPSHYQHRRLATEIAIVAQLQGYRVATEHEIARGQWFGGAEGVGGKKPDVIVRHGTRVWWVEAELARKGGYFQQFLTPLAALWPPARNIWSPAPLPGGHELTKLVIVGYGSFLERFVGDLQGLGWGPDLIRHRVSPIKLLYPVEGNRWLLKQVGAEVADPSD